LALTAVRDAPAVWHRIEQAGQRLGLCAVGHEALDRYALIRRIASPL
jgi:glycine cleavage system aminomethyltransferase T